MTIPARARSGASARTAPTSAGLLDVVRACYAEGRKSRRWAPNLRLLTVDEPMAANGYSSVVDRDQVERGFGRLSLKQAGPAVAVLLDDHVGAPHIETAVQVSA
jgi:hypothetical protein